MYNGYMPYMPNYNNTMDKIDNNIRDLENLKRNYQTLPTQNIFNVGNNTPQDYFEARYCDENTKPDEILVQRETAFIDLKKGQLTIKQVNGDIKSYEIILPKTEEQLRIEELEKKNKELEAQLKERKEVKK